MANNNSVVRDPLQGGTVLVEAKCYVDGRDIERRPGLVAVRVAVLDERGNITYVMLPWESGAFRGVPVNLLAKRLGTTPDCILVV